MKIFIKNRYFGYDWPDGMEITEENIQKAFDFNIFMEEFLELFLSVSINKKYSINSINFDYLTQKDIKSITKAILEECLFRIVWEFRYSYGDCGGVSLYQDDEYDEIIRQEIKKKDVKSFEISLFA